MLRFGMTRRVAAMLTAFAMIFALMLQTAALDRKYRFDELKMAVSVPKDYYVITRDSESSDEVFKTLELGYEETMVAFTNSDIYLRVYNPDRTFWMSVIITSSEESKTVNNYADITASARKEILENLKSDPEVESAVEVKHNNNIFFDTSAKTVSDGHTLYVNQSNTVINGMQIDLVLQKNDEEILPAENKALVNLADSLEFDEIRRTTGPIFEWWRLLLWAAILVGLALALSFLYRQRNAANRRKLQERRRQRELALAESSGEAVPENERVTFDEALGYQDDEDFENRAATDLDTYDIKVEEKNPNRGIVLFEDSGESIDDGTDYFDTYFREPADTRRGASRFFAKIWTYIKIGFRHTGYFFKNLKRKIFNRGQ